MKARFKQGRARAQSLTEVVVGLFILVPIFLAILDLASVVIGQQANNDLAKRAARAASNSNNATAAQTAAQTVVANFGTSTLLSNPTMVSFAYNVQGNVIVETSLQINLPVPAPVVDQSLNNPVMHARATEPVVALPPL